MNSYALPNTAALRRPVEPGLGPVVAVYERASHRSASVDCHAQGGIDGPTRLSGESGFEFGVDEDGWAR